MARTDAVEVFNPFSTARMQLIDDVKLFSELVYDYFAQDESEETVERETANSGEETENGEHNVLEVSTPVKVKRAQAQKVF